jgi:hypothetical protein
MQVQTVVALFPRSANPLAVIEDNRFKPGLFQSPGCGQPSRTAADD